MDVFCHLMQTKSLSQQLRGSFLWHKCPTLKRSSEYTTGLSLQESRGFFELLVSFGLLQGYPLF